MKLLQKSGMNLQPSLCFTPYLESSFLLKGIQDSLLDPNHAPDGQDRPYKTT
jgi:hypothetical protein